MTEASDRSPTDDSRTAAHRRWATTVVLGDGDTAFIRPLVPADQPALLKFHERQSADSLYRRFFSPKPSLTAKELAHFTTVDMVDRVALAVEVHDELVAWSSYERWAGRHEAEAAFMVDDEHHGRGIATLMLEHLAAIAHTNGIDRFTAEVLSDNRGMLAVFAKAGWPLQRRFESGVVDLDWELATTDEFIDTVERREQRADSRAVARILLPRAVAVVGASDREGSVGNLLWRHVRSSVSVPVHPVNPRLEDLDGRRCFGSVADLPDDVSLAIIAVPTASLESTIDACIAKRMRGAVVITSVDADDDTSGIDIPTIVARSRRNGLRLIGPSSMGVAGLHDEALLQACLVDVTLPAGGVAISMQSGTLGASLLRRADDLELGLSWFVSLGDKSDVSANDLLQFWEDDQNTKVIGLYTETFGNPRKFVRIARRVSRSTPIVAVRTGAAADGVLGAALYQQAGMIEVPTVQALLDTCRVLDAQPVLRGPCVAVITNSASPGTLAVAALNRGGLDASVAPTGLDWRSDADDYRRAMEDTLARSDVDGVMVIYAPALPSQASSMGPVISSAAELATKPVVAVIIGSKDGPVVPRSDVPAFAFPEQAAEALSRSFAYGRWLATEAAVAPSESRPVDPRRAADLIGSILAARAASHAAPAPPTDSVPVISMPVIAMEVADVTDLLATYGIEMPGTESVDHADAPDAADRVGYPVAVKALHRSHGRSAEAGVALDLADADDVRDAVATMRTSLGADAQTVMVQQMVTPGVDVRVQCSHDARLGVIVNVGYGGIDAELIGDRSSRLAPLSPASALAMLTETKVGAAVRSAGFDSSPLVDVIVQAAQLAAEHSDIDDLDLNPVVVSADGALVTDAAITLVDRPDVDGPIRRLG